MRDGRQLMQIEASFLKKKMKPPLKYRDTCHQISGKLKRKLGIKLWAIKRILGTKLEFFFLVENHANYWVTHILLKRNLTTLNVLAKSIWADGSTIIIT